MHNIFHELQRRDTREGLNYSPLVMRYEEGCTEREARPMQQQTFADPSFEQ